MEQDQSQSKVETQYCLKKKKKQNIISASFDVFPWNY